MLEHQVLDVADGLGGVEALRAGLHAVHDGVTAEELVRPFERIEPLILPDLDTASIRKWIKANKLDAIVSAERRMPRLEGVLRFC